MRSTETVSGGSVAVKRKILVTDDEPTLRLGISCTLASDDTEVDTAEEGAEALRFLASTEYDLLILDLRMQGVDGIEVVEALRKSGNPVPVILCSAEFSICILLRAVRCGVVDFLLKPANPEQIRNAVEFVLEPSKGAFSEALKSARNGNIEGAILILEGVTEPDDLCKGWMKVFRALLEDDSAGAVTTDEFIALALNA